MTLYVQLSDEERSRYEQGAQGDLSRVRPGGGHRHAPAQRLEPVHLRAAPVGRRSGGVPPLIASKVPPARPRRKPAKLITSWAGCSSGTDGDRVLIFTNDNATVYKIARRFLVPVITHQTKTKERREILLRFNSGAYPIVATSRVLNEGVNVPEANALSRSCSPVRAPSGSTSSRLGSASSARRATRRPSSTRSSLATPSRSSPPTAGASTTAYDGNKPPSVPPG